MNGPARIELVMDRLTLADRIEVEDANAVAQLRAIAARLPPKEANAVRLVADQLEVSSRHRVSGLRRQAVP